MLGGTGGKPFGHLRGLLVVAQRMLQFLLFDRTRPVLVQHLKQFVDLVDVAFVSARREKMTKV